MNQNHWKEIIKEIVVSISLEPEFDIITEDLTDSLGGELSSLSVTFYFRFPSMDSSFLRIILPIVFCLF